MSNIKKDIDRGVTFEETDIDNEPSKATACTGCNKLNSFDWLQEYPSSNKEIFEVRFKNTRKGYYANINGLSLKAGDIVAVEGNPGYDIGVISLTGDIVSKQMRKCGFKNDGVEFKKLYRHAKPSDIQKWQEAISLEYPTMIESRNICSSLNLNMKLGDVEYQGDRSKAIFYYIADERVDFRELIKILADKFRIRIEMKQIGARQEAGRIGGIGSCGRELCCSAFISNFVSVTTNSARFQEISLNPQKLAGQCGKLKCCLNYEVDAYIDARKEFPRITSPLETLEGTYYLVKNDIFRRTMTFSSDPSAMANITTIDIARVKEIIRINRKGNKVDKLIANKVDSQIVEPDYQNVIGEESITRFDSEKPQNKKNKDRRKKGGNNNVNNNNTEKPNVNVPVKSDTQEQQKKSEPVKRRNNKRRKPNNNNSNNNNNNPQS